MEITEESLLEAARRLGRTDRGRQAMADLRTFLDNGGLSLDGPNQKAFLVLLRGAFGSFPGTAREVLDDVLDPHPGDVTDSD